MIYQKTGTPFPSKKRYNQVFEYMFIFSKGSPKIFSPVLKLNKTGGDFRKKATQRKKNGEQKKIKNRLTNEYGIDNNIWRVRNGMYKSTKDVIAFEHPAIMPEEIAKKHIISWSNEENLIYDPFMGSGTTAKASHILKRNWIGSEISQEYCNLAEERLKKYLTQTTLF